MSKNKSKNVEVILILSSEHYRMIKRCAYFFEKSVEQWILQATEGELRHDESELDNAGINVGFGDEEITDVVNQIGGTA